MSVDLVSWPLLSPHVVADEPVLLRPHMPLFQFIPIRSQLSPNHPEPAERCLYFSSIYQRSRAQSLDRLPVTAEAAGSSPLFLPFLPEPTSVR